MVLKSVMVPKRHVINVKWTDKDLKELKKKADKYTNGNMSAWIRYAATQLDPKASDLTE